MPLFSIVTPAYNSERYIRRCIDSVLKQSFDDWEMIIIDDGSVDSTPSIVDEYAIADPRIRVIHQNNRGWCDATNLGISLMAGEFLIPVDSDNWLANNNCLKKLADLLTLNPKLDFVQMSKALYREGSTSPYEVTNDYDESFHFATSQAIDFAVTSQIIDRFSHGGKVIKRTLFSDIQMTGHPMGADCRFIGVVIARSHQCCCSSSRICIEMRENSLSHLVQAEYWKVYFDWPKESIRLLPIYDDIRKREGRIFPQLAEAFEYYEICVVDKKHHYDYRALRHIGRSLWRYRKNFYPLLSKKRRISFFLSTLFPLLWKNFGRNG